MNAPHSDFTVGSLFSGVGGFEVAFDRAGMTTVWQSEIDRQCQEVLAHHWPDAEQLGDVRNVGRSRHTVDLICGGFPCQDLSVAGKRAGLAGSKSGLWFEFHRVLAELKPRWCVIENVTGLLSSGERRDFAVVVQGLAELGYLSAWRVFDAQYAGVAQRRRRVFIVGHLGDGRAAEVLFESTGRAWDPPPSREKRPEATRDVTASIGSNPTGGRDSYQANLVVGPLALHGHDAGTLCCNQAVDAGHVIAFSRQDDGRDATIDLTPTMRVGTALGPRAATAGNLAVAGAISAHHGRNSGEDTFVAQQVTAFQLTGDRANPNVSTYDDIYPTVSANPMSDRRPAIASTLGVRRLTPTECERLQGFPDGHTAINGMSDSARYRMLGNAIAVPCAEWIGRRIMAAEAI